MKKLLLAALMLMLSACQTNEDPKVRLTAAAAPSQPVADESRDWGVSPPEGYMVKSYHHPTPMAVPGASTLTTADLLAQLRSATPPVVIDVLGGKPHDSIPGAVWLKGAGLAGEHFPAEAEGRFAAALATLTEGDKTTPVVFTCLSSLCWLSYNAALRAVGLGYENVGWYRGGVEAWKAAGLPQARVTPTAW